MCLKIQVDEEVLDKVGQPKKPKKPGKPITVYKILRPDKISQFRNFQWKEGLNESSRASAVLTKEELQNGEVNQGFHFFMQEPGQCPNRHLCLYPCRYLYRYRCPCIDKKAINIVAKFTVNLEDLVAVGTWEGIDSLVATKATMIEIIK